MTLIFIENLFGSGQIITVSESFDDCVLEHRLKPGENRRFVLSRFKSVVVKEQGGDALDTADRPRKSPGAAIAPRAGEYRNAGGVDA